MPRKIIEAKDVPIPVAKLIIERRLEEGNALDIQRRTLNYLARFSKMSADKAAALVEELTSNFPLSTLTAVMIANIVPLTPEELRTILAVEDRVFTSSEIERILEVIRRYVEEEQE